MERNALIATLLILCGVLLAQNEEHRQTTSRFPADLAEEIVYFRNKANISFLGASRDSVIVCYTNNEVFNPHPSNVATNEMPGALPSRRAAFMVTVQQGFTSSTSLSNLRLGVRLRGCFWRECKML